MPQPLAKLTEVPAGWPLATVMDAFAYLAAYARKKKSVRAREALSRRLVELWASQPVEAEAWLQRCRERFAKELAGKETGPEELEEALLRHGAAEWGKYGWWVRDWRFSEAGLLQGELRGSAALREECAAEYLQFPLIRDRCRELAERLVAAESQETAWKRQKLEEETSERRRLEAELEKSQEEGRELSNRLAAAEAEEAEEECRDLRNRLAVAEVEVASKDAELRSVRSEGAKCKEQCKELASRATGAEEMQKEVEEQHFKYREHCRELASRLQKAEAEASEHAKTKERLVQAEFDAAQRELEVQRLQQDESRGFTECASAEEGKGRLELRLEKAVLLARCEQLRQQLSKEDAERSAMLGRMQVLWEEKATYKERCRQLECQLAKTKPPHCSSPSVHASLICQGPAPSGQESDLSEYILVEDDMASCSSILSRSSWFSVKPDCFMADAIFKTRSSGVDFFLMGRDLRKGSQVVAADDETILEVCEPPVLSQAKETVRLQAGAATLRVTADHPVQVTAVDGAVEDGEGKGGGCYVPAGSLKPGALVMVDSGELTALTDVTTETGDCEVLKIAFKPNRPVAVFSCPPCILSKGANSKPTTRRAKMGRRRGQASTEEETADDGRASMPNTAGTSTEMLLRGIA
ncbi:unnamed protein product [Symbiodinium microadriaticum]|nr:unnamed protein product [Symbiodinium microadriaticum]